MGTKGLPRWLSSNAFACNTGDTRWSLGQEDPLEEEMATHFSILAGIIPRTKKPGGLQSMESQTVRHDWATEHTGAKNRPVVARSWGWSRKSLQGEFFWMVKTILNLDCSGTYTIYVSVKTYSSDSEESACNAGHFGSIPGLGRSPGEGSGNPFQYSSLDRGAWQAIVHRVKKSWTWLKWFSTLKNALYVYDIKINPT